jgi:hypothetical protein
MLIRNASTMMRNRQAAVRENASGKQPSLRGAADFGPTVGALSVRAVNVLKELAPELIGQIPPKGAWVPPDDLLRRLTARHLVTARNCGLHTAREIVNWAHARGVSITLPRYAGQSLSEVWGSLVARASVGKLTRAEIAEALEKSIRRKSARIPVAFQIILLEILSSTYDQPPLP